MTTPHLLAGDPEVVRTTATSYSETADAVTRAAQQIRNLARESATATSDAIKALAENAGDVAARLERLNERYAIAGSALSTYGDALATAKESSSQNADRYADAVDAYNHAQGQIDHFVSTQRSTGDIEQMEHAAEMIRYWANQRAYAQQDVSTYITRHATIESERDAAAKTAKSQIDEAVDNDGLNDSMWDNIKGWVSDHAEFLKKLKDALGWITTGLSVLSFFFPVLAPFALAAAALTAGLSLLLAASGEISWLEFGLDALALVTMGVGAVAGRTVSQAVKGLKGLRVVRVAAGGVSKSSAVRVVSGSFNSVQVGKLAIFTRAGMAKLREVNEFRGLANANAMRVFTRTKAGAGSLDSFFIDAGREAIGTMRNVAALNGAIHGLDTFGSESEKIGEFADRIGIPSFVGDGLDFVHDACLELTDATTVQAGSSW